MAEDPKRFFQQVLERGPYYEVWKLLEANPHYDVSGSIVGDRSRYVHENSTDVELSVYGHLGEEPNEDSAEEQAAAALVDKLQAELQDQVRTWNRQITRQLYAAMESVQTDEYLTEWMNDIAEWRFDEDGEQVDMNAYVPVDNLKPGIREKVLRDYADLFDRTPEQVYTALMQRDYRFDKRGNRVDVTVFKKISELDPALQKQILDKHRNLFVESDDTWAVSVEDNWESFLSQLGFERIEVRYSLGYSQGDGASFTAGSIDVKKLCEGMVKQQKVEAAASQLVNGILA